MKRLFVILFVVIAGMFLCEQALAIQTFVPHITGGYDDWTDYLQANNTGTTDATFTLTLFSGGTQVYSQDFTVEGLSRLELDIKALAPTATTGIITHTSMDLAFRISYENDGGGVAEFLAMHDLSSEIGLFFSDFSPFVEWKGAAIANFGQLSASVTLFALGGSTRQGTGGSLLGTTTVTIAPNDKAVGTHDVWFPGVEMDQVETIAATTTGESLCGLAISGDLLQTHLLFTPAVPAAEPMMFDIDATMDLGGEFPLTADLAAVYQNGNLYIYLTTKKIGGANEKHEVYFEGTVDKSTGEGSFTDQVFTITVGSTQETITLNGNFTWTGTGITGSGTIVSKIGSSTYSGTYTFTGTRQWQ